MLKHTVVIFSIFNLLVIEGNQNPQGGSYPSQYFPPSPPSDPYDQRQQQQSNPQYGVPSQYSPQLPPQQQQQQPYQPSSGQQLYGAPPRPPPPTGYGQQQLTPYGRGPPPPPQQPQQGGPGGLFSKLKNSIIAAGSAIAGGPDNFPPLPPPPSYGRSSGPPPQYPPSHPADGFSSRRPPQSQQQSQFPLQSVPPGSQQQQQGYGKYPGGPGQGQQVPAAYGSGGGRPLSLSGSSVTHSTRGSDPSGVGGGFGLLGKLKNMFAGDDDLPLPPPPSASTGRRPGPPVGSDGYGYPPQPPSHPQQQQKPLSSSSPYGQQQQQGVGRGQMPSDDIYSRPPPPIHSHHPQQQQQQGFRQPPSSEFGVSNDPFRQQQQPPSSDNLFSGASSSSYDQRGDSITSTLPPQSSSSMSGTATATTMDPYVASQYSGNISTDYDTQPSYPFPADTSLTLQHQQPQQQIFQPPPPVAAELLIPPEPQIFVVEDSIVMILKPREFLKKKIEITNAGSSQLQVFSDFEHVFTKIRNTDAIVDGISDNARSFSTAEILESSSALLPQAVNSLRQTADKFENLEMDESLFEEYTATCHTIIAKEGGLHINSIPPLTRDYVDKLNLRDGWKESLSSLAQKNVPTFLFSSGYGDIVTQVLLQGGVGEYGALPQNLRIISNFFKTAPDGSVRAFSTPNVHERNKNATTAARFMGFSVPERPNALIFGSHEDDVHMAENVHGLKTVLSVGFLEMTEDLLQRLPTFLSAYDAVVVSDSSFQYIRSVIDELLQIPPQSSKPVSAAAASQRGERKGPGQYFDIFG